MATVAVAAAQRGLEVLLCTATRIAGSSDRDRVKLYNLRKHLEFGPEELQADWGIAPEQVIDFQTLVGDSVDNVPGVPGIGDKTAAKLLQEYGTLENILANVDKISGAKRKENLRASEQNVPLTRQLVRLVTDVPLELDWEAWRLQDRSTRRPLLELFKEFGFRSLAEQVKAAALPQRHGPKSLFDDRAGSRFQVRRQCCCADRPNAVRTPDRLGEPVPPATAGQADYHLVDTPEKFEAFLAAVEAAEALRHRPGDDGLEPLHAEIVGYAFSWQEAKAGICRCAARRVDGARSEDDAGALAADPRRSRASPR